MNKFFRKRLGHRVPVLKPHTCQPSLAHMMYGGECEACGEVMGVIYEAHVPVGSQAVFIYGVNGKLTVNHELVKFAPENVIFRGGSIYFRECPEINDFAKNFYCRKLDTFR